MADDIKLKGKYMQLGPESSNIHVDFKRVGPSTNPTANQLQEMNLDANWGTKNIELGFLSTEMLYKTPEEHYHELRRLSKLTGVKTTVHAPVINLAGASPRSEAYSEQERKSQEDVMKMTIDNSKKIFGDDRRGLINIHGSEAVLNKISYISEENKGKEVDEAVYFVDKDTKKFYPVPKTRLLKEGQLVDVSPREYIKKHEGESINKSFDSLAELSRHRREYGRRLEVTKKSMEDLKETKDFSKDNSPVWRRYQELIDDHNEDLAHLNRLDEAIAEQRSEIERVSRLYNKNLKNFGGDVKKYVQAVEKEYKGIDKYIEQRAKEKYKYLKDINKEEYERRVSTDAKALVRRFKDFGFVYPEEEMTKFQPLVEFEREKASETIKNAALYSYQKYKDKAPVLSIENPYPYISTGRPEDLLSLVNTAREKLAKDLVSKEKLSKSEADKVAKTILGVTWDVGHINMLKKFGFDDEKILKEFKKLNEAGVIKHVHLTDNFGHEDSHLVPGQGNVPFKKYFEELEKKGYKGEFVLETGGSEKMMEELKDYSLHPFTPTMRYLGSESYSMGPSGERWTDFSDEFNQLYSSGFSSPRESLYEGYGAISYGSFTGVPAVFGAPSQDKKSKFSGSEMA